MDYDKVDILLAEDDINILLSLEFILQSHGYSIVTVQSGIDAVEKVKEISPSLVIMDVMMPGKNGWDALKEIKSINPETRVMLLTARSSEEDINAGKEAGMDAFLSKPYNPDQLIEIVAKLMKN